MRFQRLNTMTQDTLFSELQSGVIRGVFKNMSNT